MTIWNRAGTVISASIPAHEGNVYEPSVLPRETGAQLIDTEEPVFKMLYSGGWDHADIYYAESLDGIAWETQGAPVIESHNRPFWFRHQGVYHVYVSHHAPGEDNTRIDHFTSSDGYTFTLAHQGVITGIPETWMWGVANMSGVMYNGVLHLFLEANWGQWQIGLFTSTDFHTFTPCASNPVITAPNLSCGGPTMPYLLDGNWYMWTHRAAANAGNPYLPTDIFRWSAPALHGPWTIGTEELPRITDDEGVGTVAGQVADPYLIPVGEKVHLYYSASTDGTSRDGQQHIKLAISDVSLRDLVA